MESHVVLPILVDALNGVRSVRAFSAETMYWQNLSKMYFLTNVVFHDRICESLRKTVSNASACSYVRAFYLDWDANEQSCF